MDFVIDFRTIVLFTSWIAVTALFMSFALMIIVGIIRVAGSRRMRRVHALNDQWLTIFQEQNQALAIPRVSPFDRLEWISAWNSAYALAPTDRRLYLREVARRSGMSEALPRLMASDDSVELLEAVTMAGNVSARPAEESLRILSRSSDALVSIAASKALLQIEPSNAAGFVEEMAERADWPPRALIDIVTEESGILGAGLIEKCRTASPAVAARLIPYLRFVRSADALSFVRTALLTSTDAEVLSATLRVLAERGDGTDESSVMRHHINKDWHVRVRVARTLGSIGSARSEPVLKQLLCDRNWWVRHRAAEALASLGARGVSELNSLLPEIADPFGRDAIAHAIAEYACIDETGRSR